MSELQLRLAGLAGDSITDGPGIRLTVFVQGCPHRCPGCHNPQSHDFAGGELTGIDEILEKIRRNPLLSGVTFSGGEPFCQPGPLAELGREIRAMGLELAIYTGYTFEELTAEKDPARMELLALADTLIDGRFLLAERSLDLKFKGSRNQRILNVPASLAANAPVEETSERWV